MKSKYESKVIKRKGDMNKQLVFLILIGAISSIRASEGKLAAPPGYSSECEVYGSKPLASAPLAQIKNSYDPAEDALKKAEKNNPTVYHVNNSTCVCLCPLSLNVSIIPILHRISTRLSLGLCGSIDSPDNTENNHADYVDMRKLPENKEKWI